MSLLQPTPGEVLDRLCIVRLKIVAYHMAGKNDVALVDEGCQLLSYLQGLQLSDSWPELASQLEDTNRALWKAEDEVRIPNATVLQIASAVQNITKLNDLRCSLIRQIDKACGVESIEEKIYAQKEP